MTREFNSLADHPGAALGPHASGEIHPLRASIATDLKWRAEHYRRLADMLFDERVVALVRACARELEKEASVIEHSERDPLRSRDKASHGLHTLE
jgi:hypothetical protein